MKQLLPTLAWIFYFIVGSQAVATEEQEIRSNPKVKICDDVLPSPDDCYFTDGAPLLQVRYPRELKTGSFATWTVDGMHQNILDLVVDQGDKVTALWGRMNHDEKLIILHVPDIMVYGPYRGNSIRMKTVWRARSRSNGIVLVEDEALTGDIVFYFENEVSETSAQMQVDLGGAGMAWAGFIEGKLEYEHEESNAGVLVASIKDQWHAMANDTRKADRITVVKNWGVIHDENKDEL